MKHHPIRRALSVVLTLVLLLALIPALTAHATVVYGFTLTGYTTVGPIGYHDKYFVDTCSYECGNGCQRTIDLDPNIRIHYISEGDFSEFIENDLSDIDKLAGPHGYCEDCYEEHLCVSCFKEKDSAEMYCESCHKCNNCWDKDTHCEHCAAEADLCEECKTLGDYRCQSCHDLPACEGCGRCLVAAEAQGERCLEGGEHCTSCDEPFICDGCGDCFFNVREWWCNNCELCFTCAVAEEMHCRDCYGCFDGEVEVCEGDPTLCLDDCVAEGNHCNICDAHVEQWCSGGFDCGHCRDCAEDNGWICEQCGKCSICFDFEFCEECGLCLDCCMENVEEAGCVCMEHCVEDDEFYNAAHLCAQCYSNFSCVDDFCETCGLCKECCELNADDYGCTCGLCVEDDEFQAHLCDKCTLPTCERGDFCPDCGLCETCCLENSALEGCSCGICAESSDYEDPEHKCKGCDYAFSCNIDFCEHCGLCQDCCEDNTYREYGCSHGVCMEDPDWGEHYCAICEKCKEDCDCGQSCCADAWSGWSGHGTDTEPGSIFIQPMDKKRSVTANNVLDRAESTVTFRVKAYDPEGNLGYQWYCRRDGGTAEALTDDSIYMEYLDETLVFVGGAQTDTLTVAVPSDACHVSYTYYCVISDFKGNVLSTTDEAQLIGRHSYAWQWTDDSFHQQVCISEGCGHKKNEARQEHEIGPWRYVRYAGKTQGALLVRSCNVCGGVADTRETEALGFAHTAHDYIYTPVEREGINGGTVCTTHIRQCTCGRTEGGEEKHVWDRWIVTVPANDHRRGSKYRECMLCHYRETAEIPIQTHEHEFNLHEYDAAFYRIGADNRYHWQYCGDPECEAIAFKEEHTWSHWFWQTEAGAPQLSWRDAMVQRYCEVCGYVQVKTIRKENRPLCFTYASASVVSADNWNLDEKFTFEVTARPPVGYYFVRWEDNGEGRIKYEEMRVQKTNAYGTPLFDEYGYPIYEYRQCRPSDETVVISLDHYDENGSFLDLNTLYELDAICERYNNDLQVYYNDGNCNVIDYGSKLTQSELDGKYPYEGEPWVLWYESQEEDEYGYRTVTVHLRNYDGGPLALLNTGLPCDLRIIVDEDSNITATDQCFGILGCYTGGNVTISSSSDAELRINVRNNSSSSSAYAVKAQRDKKWYNDKVTLCGNVHLQATVTNPKAYGQTYGLYSTSWVEILDDASAEIDVCSYAYSDGESNITASAIRAKQEIQIDTTGHLFIYALTDVDSGKRARPLDAKNVIIDKVGLMEITYPANSKHAYRREPDYDHRGYLFTEYEDGLRTYRVNGELVAHYPVSTLRMEPAYPVHFAVEEGATVNVDGRCQNDFGDYMVIPGESLTFYTAPASGCYDERITVDGKSVKRGEAEGVRTKYVIGPVNKAIEVEVDNGIPFKPFASQPALTQSNVYYGSEARISYRMNEVLEVLKSHEKFSGTNTLDPTFALGGTPGHYYSGKLIESSITKNRIFLQRYNTETKLFESTGIDFTPGIVGTASFNDVQDSSALKTSRYRLMVLYDGTEYPSEEFSVTWTDDPGDMTEARTTAAELYLKTGKSANGARYYDGGAWVRLDSETECLVYDVSGSEWIGRAMSRSEYARNRKTSDLILFAEFDYRTGVLTLNGDHYYVDFDGDGEEEWYDLGGEIVAVRVPKDAADGTLVVNVKADTWIEGDYDAFGWDVWNYGDGSLVRGEQLYAQTDLIVNEKGGIRVTSKNGAELDLDRSGSMLHETEAREYAGIRASGDISIEGDVSVQIGVGLNSLSVWWDNYGADRYGLVSEGTVTVRDTAYLRTRFPVPEGRHMIGASTGIHAAEIMLTGDSVTELDCSSDSVHDNVTCYVLSTESLSVMASARLTVTAQGDIPIPIWVDGDILLATDDTVTVNALGDAEATNCFEYAGEMHLMAPTTLKAAYRDGTEEAGLVYYLEPVLDSDFVIYHMAGSDTESGLAEEWYYSGVSYALKTETDEGADTNNEYLGYEEEYPSHSLTVEREGAVLYARTGTPERIDVCAGDRVTYTAAEAISGYEFVGWSFENCAEPEDLAVNGRSISFTMPGRDVNVHAVYACSAFSLEPPFFVVTDRASTEGLLYWRVDTGIPTVHAVVLEYLTVNEAGEIRWTPLYWYEDGDWQGWDMMEDMQTFTDSQTGERYYAGVSRIGRAGVSALPRTLNTDLSTTYRIYFWGNREYYSQPFTIDFDRGVHVTLSQDRENTELVIPADYVGTEYLFDFSKYVYSGLGRMSYSLAFRDLFGPIDSSVCEARIFENGMLRFVRNGAHAPIYGIEGGAYVTATDEESGRSFTIPFDFGEIYETEAYPVFVGGRRITDRNKDDVLGDGTVSYDPETKTLTLNNAVIGEIYHVGSDAELSSGAYAIASVEDITIRLLGENRIEASRNSFCHSQPFSGTYHGTVVGIGNFINDTCRPYLDEDDDFRITFTGDGSLDIRLEGEYCEGIHSIGDITVDGPDVSITSGYSGISSETGSFTMNGGSLAVDTEELSCVSLPAEDARLTVNGGMLHFSGGADADVVSMSAWNYQNANYFRVNEGELILESKGEGRLLSNRTIYYDNAVYDVIYSDGRHAGDVVEAPATIESLNYLKFLRTYPIWVNGQQFNSGRMTIKCGDGSAAYNPETNTVRLNRAEITKGTVFWSGPPCAAGIYSKQPVNLEFSGAGSKIDLSSREYYEENGQPHEMLDEEYESGRYVYGVYARDFFDSEELYLGLYGIGSITVAGANYGLASGSMPIIFDGPNLTITGCQGGIDGNMEALSGTLRIRASAYSIYGLLNTEHFDPIYSYGGATEADSPLLDLAETDAAAEPGWGYDYPCFYLSGVERFAALSELGEILAESAGKTQIRINTELLPKATVKVIVAQYRNGQLLDVRIAEVDPEDTESAILLTFGTDQDVTYRIFVLDPQYRSLLDAFDIDG